MNEIFAYFIPKSKEEVRKRYAIMYWFANTYPVSEFEGIELLFRYYMDYSVKLKVPFKDKYLDVFLKQYLSPILKEHQIKIEGTEDLDFSNPSSFETALITTQTIMKQEFDYLSKRQTDIADFSVAVDSFRGTRFNERLATLLSQSFEMLQSTSSSDNTMDWMDNQINIIRDIYSEEKLEELSDKNDDSEKKMEFVVDTGIPAIDAQMVGLYTTQICTIEAAPGIGKTRFAIGVMAYRAAVKYKQNVAYFALEQSAAELRAMLIAHHTYNLYNIMISDKLILTGKVPAEYVGKVASAKMDLFESGKYGEIVLIDKDLYLQTFLNEIDLVRSMHKSINLVIIDYMALIEQASEKYTKQMEDFRVTAKAYKSFKKYCRKHNIAGVAVNQLNREGIKASAQDKAIDATMSAGGTESHRSSDVVLTITATEQMEALSKRKCTMPKSRSSAKAGSFMLDVRLAVCLWFQVVQQQV